MVFNIVQSFYFLFVKNNVLKFIHSCTKCKIFFSYIFDNFNKLYENNYNFNLR